MIDTAMSEWHSTLKVYNAMAVSEALITCKREYPMPPTLTIFNSICKVIYDRNERLKIAQLPKPKEIPWKDRKGGLYRHVTDMRAIISRIQA